MYLVQSMPRELSGSNYTAFLPVMWMRYWWNGDGILDASEAP